jgi:hypothetical protein
MGSGIRKFGIGRNEDSVFGHQQPILNHPPLNSLKVSAAVVDELVCVYENSIHKRYVSTVVRSVLSR